MKTPFRPEDLCLYKTITDLDCGRASEIAACTVQHIDRDSDRASSAIWLIPLDGRSPLQLTQGDSDDVPRWSPDGSRLAFLSNRKGGRQVHLIDPLGGEARQISRLASGAASAEWAPDGRCIVLTGSQDDGDAQMRLWLYRLTDGSIFPLGDESLEIVSGQAVHWAPDCSSIIALLARQGRQEIVAVSVPEGKITPLVTGDSQISMAACSANRLVYVLQDARTPNDVWCADWRGQGRTRCTDFNPWWNDRMLPEVRVRRFDVPDGEGGSEQVDGWLLRPADTPVATPLLVDAHGGPASYVLLDFNMHVYWYVLVSRGWSVLAVNPVGSSSYGRPFSARLRQRWGKYDLDQHLAAVDALRSEGLADERLAIAGKSYGGVLAAWAICNSSAFRAAVVCAPVTSLENHFGVSDSGYYADAYSMLGGPPLNRQIMRELSPMDHVENIRTPTLILQGEADERCPKSQSEELYTGIMYSTDTNVEMVLYPGGDHHFFETGKPSHRVDAVERQVGWVERWIDVRKP